MCGINGFLNFSSTNIVNPDQLLNRMNESIRHRGPDDHGIWSDPEKGIFLGHQRLSIQDLSNEGHQPMHGRRGGTIVFNGEIYNFRSLKQQFNDYSFHSDSDTEVLLALFERDGEECLSAFNGMFAFGIWDSKYEKLFLARDRVGVKPLYYTTINGVFAFSSEIKALLTLPWVKAELDERALYDFLTFNRVAPPATVFRNIRKFHPGHMMVVGRHGIERYKPYWEVQHTDYENLDEKQIKSRLLGELEKSVEYRMVSDVPVGAFLSGGVDSSAVVGLMARRQPELLKTYSIGFQDAPGFDERKHAESIAKTFDTEHHEKIVTPKDLVEFLPTIVDIYDEPLADATSIPLYFLSQLARQNGSVVVMTGDGADELFCGYRNWMRYVKLYPYYRAYSKAPRPLKQLLSSVYSRFGSNTALQEIVARAANDQELFWGGAGGLKESMKRSFLSSDYSKRMADANSYEQILDYRELFNNLRLRDGDDVDWMTYLGLKYVVPNTYLYRADRMGMAHSIEIRVPFLDFNFVNYALSIPSRWKTVGYEPKYILKKSLEEILTKDVLYRKKQGFCVPLQLWAGDVMISYIEKNLATFCRDTGLFDEQGMRAQIRATKAGKGDYIFTLWNFYFLMIWFKKWLV